MNSQLFSFSDFSFLEDRGFQTFLLLFLIALWVTGFLFAMALCKAAARELPGAESEQVSGGESETVSPAHSPTFPPAKSSRPADATHSANAKPSKVGTPRRDLSKHSTFPSWGIQHLLK